jgi:hypothetical protein
MTGAEHYALAEQRLAESESHAQRHDYLAATLAAHQAETHATLAEVATRMPRQRIPAADDAPVG